MDPMRAVLFLLLAGTDLSGLVTDALRAETGSPEEAAAVQAVQVWWDADREAVLEAIRSHVEFPAAEPGVVRVKVPLPPIPGDELAPAKNEVVVRIPKRYDPAREWPVMLVVHGTGGYADAEVEALAPFADREGLILVAPQDELRRGGGGWGYSDYEHAIHVEALRWVKRNYAVDDSRVFVYGGSRGGHAAWDLATSYPDLFAGALPVVGAPKLRYFRTLVNLRHVAVFDMQGARDDPVLVEYLRDAIGLLREWKYDVTYDEDPEAGHYYPVDWEKVGKWMKERRRPSSPTEVVCAATRDAKGRAFWIELLDLPQKKYENPPPARAPGRAPLTREQQKKLVVDHYEKYRGLVRATVAENVIDLRVEGVPRVAVWLGDGLVDLSKPVTIRVNGRDRKKAIFEPSLAALIARVKATGDRDLPGSVRVVVRGD